MKRCPTCGLTLDDSQTFCTNDGTPLVADKSSYDLGATLVAPPGGAPSTQPPQALPQAQQTGWQAPARPTMPQMFSPVADLHQPAGDRPSKFVPGLIGGIVTGILALFAGFLPVTAFMGVSLLCIFWSLVGGAVAAKLYVGRSPVPVRTGEGAVVGVVAGAFGALIYLTLDTIIAYAIQAHDIEVFYRGQGQNITGGMFFAVVGILGAIIVFGLSIVGGIIGVAMFESRKGYHTSMPPPPPGYGGPMSGGYR
jgi:hypothetical protein